MKKVIAIALTLIMALTLVTACGGDSSTPSSSTDRATNTPAPTTAPANTGSTQTNDGNSTSAIDPGNQNIDDGGTGGAAMAALIKWMMDGKYSYDFKMISEGPDGKQEGTGSWVQDGDNFSIRQEMTVEGMKMKSWIIQKDGSMYIIMEDEKMIMKMSAGMDMTEGMVTDYTGITLVGSGEDEIDGKILPYEEYSDGELGATVKYFMDGNDVYGFVSEYDGYKSTMIITNASGSVPAGAFDLPSGYTEMSF